MAIQMFLKPHSVTDSARHTPHHVTVDFSWQNGEVGTDHWQFSHGIFWYFWTLLPSALVH
eukprot:2603119-Amphidinium_carterae.1